MPILGVVENMSFLMTPQGEKIDVFGEGGGRRTAEEMNVPLLAEIALSPEVRKGGDNGQPVATRAESDSEAAPFLALARLVDQRCNETQGGSPKITIED